MRPRRWLACALVMIDKGLITQAEYDSTQSFNDLAGNSQVKRSGSYAGDHGQFTMGVRNSRIGFRIRAPEWHRIRAGLTPRMEGHRGR